MHHFGLAAVTCIRSHAAMRDFNRLKALLRLIVSCLFATQLTACVAAHSRDGVPTKDMATAEVSGYPSEIRVWGDLYASYPAERLALFHNQRVRAARTDRFINLNEIDALTLSGGGSSGAFGAGILAGWTKAGNRPKFDIVTGISAGSLIAPFAFLGPAYDEQIKEGITTITTRSTSTPSLAHWPAAPFPATRRSPRCLTRSSPRTCSIRSPANLPRGGGCS